VPLLFSLQDTKHRKTAFEGGKNRQGKKRKEHDEEGPKNLSCKRGAGWLLFTSPSGKKKESRGKGVQKKTGK